MKGLFFDQVVLITGAGSGFGAETARLFAKEGAKLILIGRREEKLMRLATELKQMHNTESLPLAFDVSDYERALNILNELPDPFAIPDILINNAGLVRGMAKLWEVNPDEWNEMIDTNVKGVLNISRLIIPKMMEAGKGHVINIGSTSAHGTYPGGGVYATKYAVRALTDTLRMELVGTPIRVSLISPGMAKTEFSLVRFSGDQEKADKTYEGIEALTATDIAETIVFIASRPAHVNIADIIIYPKQQASPTLIHRK